MKSLTASLLTFLVFDSISKAGPSGTRFTDCYDILRTRQVSFRSLQPESSFLLTIKNIPVYRDVAIEYSSPEENTHIYSGQYEDMEFKITSNWKQKKFEGLVTDSEGTVSLTCSIRIEGGN